MGEYLVGQGFSALGVRLSGHATRPEDMIRSRYQDWTASVEDGYNLLDGIADRIFLVGLSIDGPKHLHDAYRKDAAGQGSFEKLRPTIPAQTDVRSRARV